MQQFTPIPGSFKQIRKQTLIRSAVVLPILLIACAIISLPHDKTEVNVMPYTVGLLAVVLVYSVFRAVNRQKLMFESYVLKITDNTLIREQLNMPITTITYTDIDQILKSKNGAIVIKATSSKNNIYIPAQIDNSAELEAILTRIKGFTVKTGNTALKLYLNYAAVLMSLVGMVCIYTVDNKIVVGISGAITIVMMIRGIYVIRTNKNIDEKTRRSLGLFIIVLLSIIATVYFKLFPMK
ncbi:hypothetical protein ACFGVR_16625 [Mucilaginibacter sp. AW1-3]